MGEGAVYFTLMLRIFHRRRRRRRRLRRRSQEDVNQIFDIELSIYDCFQSTTAAFSYFVSICSSVYDLIKGP